jgi:hypothetical protein
MFVCAKPETQLSLTKICRKLYPWLQWTFSVPISFSFLWFQVQVHFVSIEWDTYNAQCVCVCVKDLSNYFCQCTRVVDLDVLLPDVYKPTFPVSFRLPDIIPKEVKLRISLVWAFSSVKETIWHFFFILKQVTQDTWHIITPQDTWHIITPQDTWHIITPQDTWHIITPSPETNKLFCTDLID